jgi:hypothetical protein
MPDTHIAGCNIGLDSKGRKSIEESARIDSAIYYLPRKKKRETPHDSGHQDLSEEFLFLVV